MLAILDYKAGNLTSVKRALDYLDIPCTITADAHVIAMARAVSSDPSADRSSTTIGADTASTSATAPWPARTAGGANASSAPPVTATRAASSTLSPPMSKAASRNTGPVLLTLLC